MNLDCYSYHCSTNPTINTAIFGIQFRCHHQGKGFTRELYWFGKCGQTSQSELFIFLYNISSSLLFSLFKFEINLVGVTLLHFNLNSLLFFSIQTKNVYMFFFYLV